MQRTTETRPPHGERGFTLLEVLVALTIVAVALVALVRASADSTRGLTYLRDKTLAHWVDLNEIAQMQLRPDWPALGESSGQALMGRQSWRWTATVQSTPDDTVRRLRVTVRAASRGQPLDSITAYLPRPTGDGG
jgi:general secretion pathway protein I